MAEFAQSRWQQVAGEIFPDEQIEAAPDLYYRLMKPLVWHDGGTAIEPLAGTALESEVTLEQVESAEKSARMSLAYSLAYKAHMRDAMANTVDQLEILRNRYHEYNVNNILGMEKE